MAMKKNGPGGCDCCCAPIDERDDDFPLQWPCWRGDWVNPAYEPLNPDWEFDTAAGELVRNDTGTSAEALDGILAEAIGHSLPFTMETEMWVAQWAQASGGEAGPLIYDLAARILGGFGSAITLKGRLWFYPKKYLNYSWVSYGIAQANDPGGGRDITTWFTGPAIDSATTPFKVMYRVQFDENGVTHWVYVNDILGTEIAEPGVGTSPWLFGVKRTYPILSGFLPSVPRYWGFSTSQRSNTFPGEIGRVDRWHISQWNHVTDPRPLP